MKRSFLLVLLALAMNACTASATVKVQENRADKIGQIEPDGAITVVSLTHNVGVKALTCLDEMLGRELPDTTIVAHDTFRNALFPWFEPGTAPTNDGELAVVLDNPLVGDLIADMNVRYVVFVTSGTVSGETDTWGFSTAGGPSPYAIGAGGISTNFANTISAKIVDLEERQSISAVRVSANSWGGAGIIIVVPVVILSADTEKAACEALGERIVGFFSGAPIPPADGDSD